MAWLNQVSHEIDAALKESDLVAVEGYLLLPILLAIQERFTGKAIIKTYEARNRQYFMSSTIEKIAGM